MRAVVVRSFGGPEALEIAELPIPRPGPGQLRVRVQAAAVNPIDLAVRSGFAVEAGLVPARDSLGMGFDVAGVVDELGDGVTGHALGDRVVGLSDRLDIASGTHAEYVVLDTGAVAAAPRGVSAEAAAGLPLNGLTAIQLLAELDLAPGQALLVTGAAGGVGGYAVQLAAAQGLRVVAVAGGADEGLVRGFGAEFFVPRDVASLGDAVRAQVPGGVHGALDAALVGLPALDAVRGRGRFGVVAGAAPPPLRLIQIRRVNVAADAAQLAELVALVEAEELTLRVAETFPLEKAAEAHERLAEGGIRGRLVLVP